MCLEAGFRPDPLAAIRGRKGGEGKKREAKEGKGEGRHEGRGEEREETGRKRREGRAGRGKEICFMARGIYAPANILFATVRISLVFFLSLCPAHVVAMLDRF